LKEAYILRLGNHQKVFAICNEDLERETDVKTSAVHFMRFEFNQAMIDDFVKGFEVKVGADHPNYICEATLETRTQDALNQDFGVN